MVTLHIEHPITDYGTWRTAFDSFAQARLQAGVISEHVARPVDDPRYIVVTLGFESTERVCRFPPLPRDTGLVVADSIARSQRCPEDCNSGVRTGQLTRL